MLQRNSLHDRPSFSNALIGAGGSSCKKSRRPLSSHKDAFSMPREIRPLWPSPRGNVVSCPAQGTTGYAAEFAPCKWKIHGINYALLIDNDTSWLLCKRTMLLRLDSAEGHAGPPDRRPDCSNNVNLMIPELSVWLAATYALLPLW